MITGYLYKNNKLLLLGLHEDLIDFVEKLKRLNKDYIDRREFKVLGISGDTLKQWFRK